MEKNIIIVNELRKYFGLKEIEDSWKKIDVQSANFQDFNVSIFVDGQTVKKCIIFGNNKFKEFQLDETLSKNLDCILPKDSNKKPSTLDSIINKSAVGVTLSFDKPNISIYNETTNKTYYTNAFDENKPISIVEFADWIHNWCENSTAEDVAEINEFANEKVTEPIPYKEGDVFRVKLSRNQYTYGRILLDYNKMRNNKEKFWDIFMGTPVVASLYHIVTDRKNVTIDELKNLPSFPSENVMDKNFLTGEYEIIGNIPVDYKKEDYPIMYGNSFEETKKVCYQNGKVYFEIPDVKAFSQSYKNNGVSSRLGYKISLMKKCIEQNSNLPIFEEGPLNFRNDLRNPNKKEILEQIQSQFDI